MPKQVIAACAVLGFHLASEALCAEEPYRHWGEGTNDKFYDAQHFGKQGTKVFVLL